MKFPIISFYNLSFSMLPPISKLLFLIFIGNFSKNNHSFLLYNSVLLRQATPSLYLFNNFVRYQSVLSALTNLPYKHNFLRIHLFIPPRFCISHHLPLLPLPLNELKVHNYWISTRNHVNGIVLTFAM